MRYIFFLIASVYLFNASAQDFEKGKTSYFYYEGIKSKKFDKYSVKASKPSAGAFYKKNSIKLGFLEALYGKGIIYYERSITSSFAVELGLGVTYTSILGRVNGYMGSPGSVEVETKTGGISVYPLGIFGIDNERKRKLGMQFTLMPKYYFKGEGQKGFYLAAGMTFARHNFLYTAYNNLTWEESTHKEYAKELGFGGGLGWAGRMNNCVIDAGIQIFYSKLSQETYVQQLDRLTSFSTSLPQLAYYVKIGGLFGK